MPSPVRNTSHGRPYSAQRKRSKRSEVLRGEGRRAGAPAGRSRRARGEDPRVGRGLAAPRRRRMGAGRAGCDDRVGPRSRRADRDRAARPQGQAGPAPARGEGRESRPRAGPQAPLHGWAVVRRQPIRHPARAGVHDRGMPLAAGAMDRAGGHPAGQDNLDAGRPVQVDPPPGQASRRGDQRPLAEPPDPGVGEALARGGDRLLGTLPRHDVARGLGIPGLHGVAGDRRQARGRRRLSRGGRGGHRPPHRTAGGDDRAPRSDRGGRGDRAGRGGVVRPGTGGREAPEAPGREVARADADAQAVPEEAGGREEGRE